MAVIVEEYIDEITVSVDETTEDITVSVQTATDGGTEETPATIKFKYEQNADTNAFTDAEKTKLENALTELPEHSHDEYLTELPEHSHPSDETKINKTSNIQALWRGTQAEYDALTPDPNTLYFIEE